MRITSGGNMNHTEFFDKLKAGYAARGYLFTGEENFVKREALSGWNKSCCPRDWKPLTKTYWRAKPPTI